MSNSFRITLKWLGIIACAVWLIFGIQREIFELDPSQFGFRAPGVEASMKNCTSEDPRLRYECKEQAILANQRLLFVETFGRWMLVFAPPILVMIIARLVTRPRHRDGGYMLRPPPPIKKWRVK